MDFREWIQSNEVDAVQYRRRIEAGEAGYHGNPEIAAKYAYDAGIREGLGLAIARITAIIMNRRI